MFMGRTTQTSWTGFRKVDLEQFRNGSPELLTITIKVVWRSLALCTCWTFEFTSWSVSPHKCSTEEEPFQKECLKAESFSKVSGKCWGAQPGITVSNIQRGTILDSFGYFILFVSLESEAFANFPLAFLDTYQDLCPHWGHSGFSFLGLFQGYLVCETLVSTLPWRQTWKQCQHLTALWPWRLVCATWSLGTNGPLLWPTDRTCWYLTKKQTSPSIDLLWHIKALLKRA